MVLASARGPLPNLAEAAVGEPIRGSWWAHRRGAAIFAALNEVADSPDVRCFRLVDGKLTLVHRRLWPALVKLAGELGRERLTAIRQEHTKTGAHRNVETRYPKWVPPEIARAARELSVAEARAAVIPFAHALDAARRPRRRL